MTRLNKEDLDYILREVAGLLLHLIQHLICKMWAIRMATMGIATALVACHHLMVLHAMSFLLRPN